MLELFHRRYACKAYDPSRPVTDEEFAQIIEAGRLAPSAMGFEPWHFVHLTDPELIAALQPHAWGGLDKIGVASHLVLLLGRVATDLYPDSEYVRQISLDIQGMTPEMLAAKQRRMTTFLSTDQEFTDDRLIEEWVARQVYLALSNMMLAAALLDVDSTPLEGFNRPAIDALLRTAGVIDEHHKLVVMVTFGHAAGPVRPKVRRPLESVFTRF